MSSRCGSHLHTDVSQKIGVAKSLLNRTHDTTCVVVVSLKVVWFYYKTEDQYCFLSVQDIGNASAGPGTFA